MFGCAPRLKVTYIFLRRVTPINLPCCHNPLSATATIGRDVQLGTEHSTQCPVYCSTQSATICFFGATDCWRCGGHSRIPAFSTAILGYRRGKMPALVLFVLPCYVSARRRIKAGIHKNHFQGEWAFWQADTTPSWKASRGGSRGAGSCHCHAVGARNGTVVRHPANSRRQQPFQCYVLPNVFVCDICHGTALKHSAFGINLRLTHVLRCLKHYWAAVTAKSVGAGAGAGSTRMTTLKIRN